MLLFDYECLAHGRFEGVSAECPSGCSGSLVRKVFLKAPGHLSDRSKNIDTTFQNLANDFGLTDMNNQNGTSAAVRPDPMKLYEREQAAAQLQGHLGDTSQAWRGIPSGATGINQALAQSKASPDNALAPLLPELRGPTPNVVAKFDADLKAA